MTCTNTDVMRPQEREEPEPTAPPSASISLVSEMPSNRTHYSVPIALDRHQHPKTRTPSPKTRSLGSTSTTSVSLVGPDEVKLSGSWEDRLYSNVVPENL